VKNHRPYFYRRVRLFCELPPSAVSLATGVSEYRYVAIETGRREPNPTERRLIESFLRDKLQSIVEMEGPVPSWLDGSHDDKTATNLLGERVE
jgi:hypothetical protein